MAETEKNNNRIFVPYQYQKFLLENGDWHPADIKAALERRGLSLAEVSRQQGYHSSAGGRCLRTTWPAMEEIIAEALNQKPQSIWPSRYDGDIPLKYKIRRRNNRNGS